MANRPASYIRWVSDGSPSKVTQPPQAQLDSGWVPGEPIPAQYLNWLLMSADLWIQYLDQASTAGLSATAVQFSARMINAGPWSFVASTGALTFSSFNIAYPGLVDTVNTVTAGTVTIADGQCAYVNVNLPQTLLATASSGSNILSNLQTMQGLVAGLGVNGPGIPANTTIQTVNVDTVTLSAAATASASQQTFAFFQTGALTMQVATESSLALQKNTALLARRFGNVVAVGLNTAEMALRDGESKTIRNGGYGYVTSLVAGVALTDRQALYLSNGAGGRTAGAAYPCDTSAANGAARGQFFGFANGAAASGANVAIVCSGIMGGFSGLTAGSVYYVDPANPGALTTTKTVASGQFAMPVGIATSATTLMISPPGGNSLDRPVNEDFAGNVTALGVGASAAASGILTLLSGTMLIPGTANAQDLGSSAIPFNNGFFKSLIGTQVQSNSFLTLGGSTTQSFQGSLVPTSTTLGVGTATAPWNSAYITSLMTNAIQPFPGQIATTVPTLLPNNTACNLGSYAAPFAVGYVRNLKNYAGYMLTPTYSFYVANTAALGGATTYPFLIPAVSTSGTVIASNVTGAAFRIPGGVNSGAIRFISGYVNNSAGGTMNIIANVTVNGTVTNYTLLQAVNAGYFYANWDDIAWPFDGGANATVGFSFQVSLTRGGAVTAHMMAGFTHS